MEHPDLEKCVLLQKALAVVEEFCDPGGQLTDREIHLKTGITKILSEEYFPLVQLARTYNFVKCIRLFPTSIPGPDGEIRFWWRMPSRVQITCANENYNRALMREQLANGEPVFVNQSRCRISGRNIEAQGRVLMASLEDVGRRLSRIIAAIERKNGQFYEGTDTLLVQDDSVNFMHLGNLHQQVCHSVREGCASNYKRVFVVYGSEVKRAK